jgi:hypothetical protein
MYFIFTWLLSKHTPFFFFDWTVTVSLILQYRFTVLYLPCVPNVSFGTTVPEGFERYLYPTCRGALLGPWACRSVRK